MRATAALFVLLALASAGCSVRRPGPLFCLGCTIYQGRPPAPAPLASPPSPWGSVDFPK